MATPVRRCDRLVNLLSGAKIVVPMAEPLTFPAHLSAAVVAFTIEADNEAARRLAHTTTSFGATGPRGSVWMTSIAMWFNCLRWLPDGEQVTVAELERRARMPTNLDGMRRWGYITIDGIGRVARGQPRPRAKSQSTLAITRRGRAAADVWRPLPAEIEGRWRERFGAAAVGRLRGALGVMLDRAELALPEFLPIGSVYGVGIGDPKPAEASGDREGADDRALITLLSQALLLFALDYERGAKLSLAVHLDGLRVLDTGGVALADLPRRTGVSKEAIAMLVKHLERVGCVELVPSPDGGRGKHARLTDERGVGAQAAGAQRRQRLLDTWRQRFGATTVSELQSALEPIVGDGTRAGSPLFDGLEPYPDGWRAQVPAPDLLPWFPMVLHRGGYPDGS
jgi:DNA-binding MarR family transcriptional regulator